jgi:hypothetical protein
MGVDLDAYIYASSTTTFDSTELENWIAQGANVHMLLMASSERPPKDAIRMAILEWCVCEHGACILFAWKQQKVSIGRAPHLLTAIDC